jgi:hypothetical protein
MNFGTRINLVALRVNQQGRLKKYLGIALAVFTVAAAGTLMNFTGTVVKAGSGPIVTIDPTQLPLPVSGSATVSGTVAATQSGPWNVGITGTPIVGLAPGSAVAISGTPTVNIASGLNVGITGNSASNPLVVVSADNPAKSAFTITTPTQFSNGPSIFTSEQIAVVPPGQRYVIEHYNVVCEVDNGGTLADVAVLVGPVTGVRDDALPHVLGIGNTSSGWGGNGTTRVYAEPGQTISVGAVANGGSLSSCFGEVSGYSVPVP